MKKTNTVSLISTSLLTAGFILGGSFAFIGDANALTAQVRVGTGGAVGAAGKPATFQVSKIELSSQKIPELNGIKIEGAWLDKFASLHDKLATAAKLNGHALLQKYTTVTVFDGNNTPHTLTGFASNGMPIVGPAQAKSK